jgi:hypothetical protein
MNTLAKIALVNRDGTDFSDLNADLDAEQAAGDTAAPATENKAFGEFYGVHQAPTGEICPRCKGKGRYIVGSQWYGFRDLGPCFSCGGSGSVSAEKAKAMRAHQKGKATIDAKRQALEAKIEAFRNANPDLIEYCNRHQDDFTAGCFRKLTAEGEMSGPQIAARNREQAERVAAAAPVGTGLDLSRVPAGRYAVPNGDTRLKVLIRKPDAPGKWAGWVFVSDAAEYGSRRNYGKQAPGKTYSGQIFSELRAIAADPKAAAIAYGKLTGTCSICGRRLENEESVAAGIGPICANKQGW